ncbi:hydroxymethylbilane synthase [Anaerolineales bacterium HSG6]|nr:hydroxymethylbilane synthase [Anaerolineales bacterium HSG6]MDM8530960.1 hydroxymethylbilane synthase [Anaerolineales bacterium HSG25]
MKLTIGSRKSMLAQTQTNMVKQMLLAHWPDLTVEIDLIDTQGDLNRTDPLPEIGGKGLFTLELEEALRAKRIDLAVHSLKDLPVEDSPDLAVVAIPVRAAAQDMLVSHQAQTITELPPNAVVGTSSRRRAAQVLALRPDVTIKDIRGNVDTRLRKLDDPNQGYDAILLAQAGLDRLGYDLAHAHALTPEQMLPAPGQGALGIQGRADDPQVNAYLQALDDSATRNRVVAERAFLNSLGGGCSLPVGAWATLSDHRITLQGIVASADGKTVIKIEDNAPLAEAEQLGRSVAQRAIDQGAKALLDVHVS